MFNINFYTFAKRYIAPEFRLPIFLAWVYTFMKPLMQRLYAPSVVNEVRYPICLGYNEPSVTAYFSHILARISYNCQTISLEKLLNLYYYSTFLANAGKGNPGYWIWIEQKVIDPHALGIFLQYENRALALYRQSEYATPPPAPVNGSDTQAGPQYLYTMEEILSGPDYIVNVPTSLSYTNVEMKKVLDTYNAAGRRYIINYY